jgi:hypothetical protein
MASLFSQILKRYQSKYLNVETDKRHFGVEEVII